MRRFTLLLFLFFLTTNITFARYDALKGILESYIADKKADIGIAVVINSSDTVTVNGSEHFPLMSVVKFHQALAVAKRLEEAGKSLHSTLYISKSDLPKDTYSPLRDLRPEGDFEMPVDSLLRYTLQLSDNNACDILFKNIASPSSCDRFIRSLGLSDFSIGATEQMMHDDLSCSALNWATPLHAVRLIETFISSPIISPANKKFILDTMLQCTTGTDRLPKPLIGTGASIAHKTGSGPASTVHRGIVANDIGFVSLPSGTHYSIAVFVNNSLLSPTETAQIIADISTFVYFAVK